MNKALIGFVFTITSTVCMGVFLAAALIMGYITFWHIIGVVMMGLLLSIPITLMVAKQLNG